jgi:prepilin-type N-terminal cleavage/methylation domain-containing protein
MRKSNLQSGFTLIELAIVLVIIGLLLGGVLKGAELITGARVRNMANQASGVQAAYYGFVDRYRRIPGDMPPQEACDIIGNVFLNCSVGGDGNARIDSGAWDEASAVWAHLAAAGFIQGAYDGQGTNKTSYRTLDRAAPTNVFNGRLLLARTGDYEGTPAVRLNLVLGREVPVNVIRELDVKLDDGLPQTGVLRAGLSTGAAFGAVAQGDTTCVDTDKTPPIWDINADAQDCNAVYLY